MTGIGLLLGLGGVLAIAHQRHAWLLTPVQKAVDGIAWPVWLLDAIWLPITRGAARGCCWPGCGSSAAGTAPCPAGPPPPVAREHPTVIVTPGGVATALAHLGIPAMNRAVKDGWQVEFATPPVRVNGRGYQTTFSLPMGVTPEMVADKRDVLARNLVRAPLEVWPTAAERAGYVDLWVADQGSTERPAPPYPLLHDGVADVFAGVPLGVSQRGEVIAPALPGANVAFGGVMGQGKSNAARVVMAGAALDPLAELWVFVFANNGDFDAYRPRLTRYHRGVDEHTIAAAVDALHALYARSAGGRPGWPSWARRRSPGRWPRSTRTCGRWSRCSPSATNCSATPTTAGRRRIWPCRPCAAPARPRSRLGSTRSRRGPTRSPRRSSSWSS